MLTESKNDYFQNGLLVYSGSDRVRIVYHGLLAENGATNVYAHVGYGDNWKDTSDYNMLKVTQGFEASILLQHTGTFNVAFKDSANNWDNNSGKNYTFTILD